MKQDKKGKNPIATPVGEPRTSLQQCNVMPADIMIIVKKPNFNDAADDANLPLIPVFACAGRFLGLDES